MTTSKQTPQEIDAELKEILDHLDGDRLDGEMKALEKNALQRKKAYWRAALNMKTHKHAAVYLDHALSENSTIDIKWASIATGVGASGERFVLVTNRDGRATLMTDQPIKSTRTTKQGERFASLSQS